MAPRFFLTLAFFALIAGLWACEAPTPVVPLAAPSAPSGSLEELRCTVSMAAETLVCERPDGKARGDLILGGQGVRVRLTSSNVSIDPATSTLSADVTVRNLMSQPIGTPDGTTVSGVKVFFHQLPTVTDGSGTVSVQNPDGTGTFTAANQPYFLYDAILHPQGTSAAKPWKFTVPATATAFVFSVYVAAAAPIEAGVTRWTWKRGRGTLNDFSTAVWGTSDSSVYVVGYSNSGVGSVMHWNGHTWTELLGTMKGVGKLYGVSGTSDRDVWVAAGSELLHYDGGTWRRYPADGANRLFGVWAATPDLAYAVGTGSTVLRWNGSEWNRVQIPDFVGTPEFYAVWGTSPHDVWVAGGRILHFDGTSWTVSPVGGARWPNSLWGSSPTDVWVMNGEFALHYNGTEWVDIWIYGGGFDYVGGWGKEIYAVGVDRWARPLILSLGSTGGMGISLHGEQFDPVQTAVGGSPDGHFVAVGHGPYNELRKAPFGDWIPAPASRYLTDVVAISPNDAYAVGAEVLHWNGSAWSTVQPSSWYYAATHDGAGTVYMVGYGGALGKVVNGVPGTLQSPTTRTLTGAWAADASNVFAVGDGGTIIRSSGAGIFTTMPSGTTQTLTSVWGSSPTDVFAVGHNATILHYDGTTWSAMPSPTNQHLDEVHGTGPHDVWAVGSLGTVLHYDGSSWENIPTGTTRFLSALWTAPDGTLYVGGNFVLMRYANGAWGSYPAPYWIDSLAGVSANEVFAVGTGGLILHGQR
ncbi:MAG TPA: hypothetical protein VFS20_14225 [Longimicrobium sp.]|nr:hypothetical protein [Longimicrobium sp.]